MSETARASGTDNLESLRTRLQEAAGRAGLPPEVLTDALTRHDYFRVTEWVVPRRGELAPDLVAELTGLTERLLRCKVFAHPAVLHEGRVEPVVFGTGGHRGEIGKGLTLLHVHVIVTAMLEALAGMTPEERRDQFGAAELAAVQQRGFVLAHDNRLFNPDFALYAAHLLREAGYRAHYAGRAASPELSLAVPRLGYAGSLNFTPSHNPFRYGGVKFSPADGGLAGTELTEPLAEAANTLLANTSVEAWPSEAVLGDRIDAARAATETVDVHEPYLEALAEHPMVRLDELAGELRGLAEGQRLCLVADPVFGAAVPVYERLQERLGADTLYLLHTEDDPYFGGQTTEPNEETLEQALDVLRTLTHARRVAVRNDPDADRGLVGDATGAIKMNRFAAMVARYLLDRGEHGDLLTTLPTSQFGPAFARARGVPVHLTATGFKNFRSHLSAGGTMLAYEESDGLTLRGHTLDKDGVLAGLLAVRMVLHYGKPLGELLAELEAEVGQYHWRQETFFIDMPAKEARQRLQRLQRHGAGETLEVAGRPVRIEAVDATDGFRFALEDGSWVMMRPSGTEPKVRVYAETREGPEATEALCEAGKALAMEAIQAGA